MLFLYIGHGGSDGLHGYVPSLDHVVADTVSLVGILTNFEEPFTLNSMLQKLFVTTFWFYYASPRFAFHRCC